MDSIADLRTWLFVPGDDERKMARCLHLQADTLVLDWEDSVLPTDKERARKHTSEMSVAFGRDRLFFVRINGRRSPWFEDDMSALAVAKPDGIIVPKCESAADVREVGQFFERIPGRDCRVCPLIESPRGLLEAANIASASERMIALAFGAEALGPQLASIERSGSRSFCSRGPHWSSPQKRVDWQPSTRLPSCWMIWKGFGRMRSVLCIWGSLESW